jgi:DMSO/TMAO reductase YedYZ molybdopterin-dependent catalytic subunit
MRKLIILLISFFLLSAFLAGCTSNTGTNIKELAATEVKEYKGKDLSSILDFRENSIKGPQYIDIDTYALKVDGLVENPMDFTYNQVLGNTAYTKVVTLNCVEGWSVDILWEGILLKDIFETVQVKSSANTVIFYSYDGYSTSLPLQTILDKDIMIAYKMNGLVLPAERGFPFQLVAEDKLGYKWAKWITRIELSDDANYKGYWEQRGYE